MSYKFSVLLIVVLIMSIPLGRNMALSDTCIGRQAIDDSEITRYSRLFQKKINFVFARNRCTPNPEGWEEYNGSIYNPERGYGWLIDLSGKGRDRGIDASIRLADGGKTSPQALGRPELANWQGRHKENRPLVFRIDLPDGWYRVSCASVDPGTKLPVVDQRCIKCRAHDVIIAGPDYGRPLTVRGNQLVEGEGIVEVTEGHLRIIVGDVAYRGWTWNYQGSWYKGWIRWLGLEYKYANGWYQKLTRKVDPGFHMLRLNSLEIEEVDAPSARPEIVFRDFFNRDDSLDVNKGVDSGKRWVKMRPCLAASDHIQVELYQTAVKFNGLSDAAPSAVGLIQKTLSPEKGIVRYSTRVSLFAGEGSQVTGAQEAGIVLLANVTETGKLDATFVGVALDSSRPETVGRMIYRVDDGKGGYSTNLEIPDTALPISITEGEFEIIVEHDVTKNLIRNIKINGVNVIDHIKPLDLMQRNRQGFFGIQSVINNKNSGVRLKQFYWYYRVEKINEF